MVEFCFANLYLLYINISQSDDQSDYYIIIHLF